MPSPLFKVVDDILFIAIIVDLLLSKKTRKKKYSPYALFFLFFFLIFVVWGFAVGNNLTVILLSVRQYKNIFLLFYISVYNAIDEKFVWRVLQFTLYGSIPLSIYQRITSSGTTGDAVVGLLGRGASGYLTILILFYFFSELYTRLKDGKKIVGYYWLTLIPTFINETKIIYILFPVLYILVLSLSKRFQIKQMVLSGIVVFCFILGSDYVYSVVYVHRDDNAAELFTKEGLESYLTTDKFSDYDDLGRFSRIIVVHEFLKKPPAYHYLFGYGIGGTFVGNSSGANGLVTTKIQDQRVNYGSRIQLYVLLGEFGVLGTVVLVAFLLVILTNLIKHNTVEYRAKAAIIVVLMIFSLSYNLFGQNTLGTFLFYYYLLLAFGTHREADLTLEKSAS